MTALSVLNVTKYPPSLLYALVTLGSALLLLSAIERLGGFAGEMLATFGRVPLFIYLLHLYAAHAVAVVLWLGEGFEFRQLLGFGVQAAPPEGLGLSLAGTYAVCDPHHGRALPSLPVVCQREAAAARLVAELFVMQINCHTTDRMRSGFYAC